MAKPKLVIFCGAGFSAPRGIPTMERFSTWLRESEFCTKDEQADLDIIHERCRALTSVIGESIRNIEQLASFLSMLSFVYPEFTFDRCRVLVTPAEAIAFITKCIAYAFGHPMLRSKDARISTEALRSIVKDASVTFVTTNYDLHIEYAMIGLGRPPIAGLGRFQKSNGGAFVHGSTAPLYDPRSWKVSEGSGDHDEDELSIKLFKLHGSVSWMISDSVAFSEHAVAVKSYADMAPSNFTLDRPGAVSGDAAWEQWCRETSHLIVPPTVIKSSFFEQDSIMSNCIRDQWIGSSKAIRECDHLWFVGYSFPQTDSFIRFFLGASLFENVRLRQVAVIDPSFDVIQSRARPIFASPEIRDMFVPIPAKWEEVNLVHLLGGDYAGALGKRRVHLEEARYMEEFRRGTGSTS